MMRRLMSVKRGIVLLLITHGMAACGPSVTPAAPTPAAPATPAAPEISVTSISPTLGSTGGATQVTIAGAGLGTTVTFGGATVKGTFDGRHPGALMFLATPAHAAGTVDVVVSGQNGQSLTLINAFTYASPSTFDFNGTWSGFGWNGQDNPIRFTIQNDTLLSASCDSLSSDPGATLTFSPPLPVMNREFSFDGNGVRFSGRMVSPTMATGTIRLGECASLAWYAEKP